ncbi:MAG: hypothetical protein Q4Q23_07980, partial [Methanobacteriaceae archaeon]|nr:hypothetical protein [Methanobacteriaceae archaeon]
MKNIKIISIILFMLLISLSIVSATNNTTSIEKQTITTQSSTLVSTINETNNMDQKIDNDNINKKSIINKSTTTQKQSQQINEPK